MSDQTTSAQRVTVILNGPNDWDEWIEIIKAKARSGMIWEFVNPAIAKAALPTLTRPLIPTAAKVNAAKTSIATLDETEKELFKAYLFDYKEQLSSFKQKESALLTLCTYIQERVSRNNLVFTFNCETAYDMLVNLKNRVSPTDQARKIELVNRYQRMKMTPKAQNIDAWLQEWEKVYTNCKALNLPDVDEDRSLFDFLHAISNVAPEFTTAWKIEIQKSQAQGEELPSLYKMVEYFRNDRRLFNALNQEGATHSAFTASFPGSINGKSTDETIATPEPSGTRPKQCICGAEHQFKDCLYIVECLRPEDWEPDSAIQEQVEERIQEGSQKMKLAIKWARKNAAEEQERQAMIERPSSEQPGIFMV
jgi:hypothetical protein